AALAADDAALHGVVRDRHHGDADRRRDLGGAALDRLGDDVRRAALGLGVRLLDRRPDAHGLLALELALDALEHHGRGLLAGELGDLVELRREPRLAGLELLLARLQLGGALVQPLLGLVEPQGARVLLLAAAVEAVLLLVEPLALAPELLAHVAQLRPLALRLLAYALQLGPDALALARQVLLEALAQALLLFGPAAARLLELRLRRALGQLHRALGLALRLLEAGAETPMGRGAGVGLVAPPQGQGGARAAGEALREEEETDDGADDGSPARSSSEAVDQATLAPPLPADIACITACLMASTRSGLVL